MKYSIFLLLMAFSIGSCNIIDQKRIKGNGNIITKTYDYTHFSSVDIGNDMDIRIRQDSIYSVKIETDENLLNHLNLKMDGDKTLDIETASNTNLDPTESIKVYITAPSLKKIDLSGAARLQTDGKFEQDKKFRLDLSGASSANISVKAPVVELDASGASTITVEGESRDVNAEASGASTINAFNLLSESAEAEASGASTIRIFSSIQLKARANGASSVKYKGNPTVSSNASGASSVSKE